MNIIDIGLFSLVALPYAFNFIWAPVIDSLKLPILNGYFGKRCSWIIFLQVVLSVFLYSLGFSDPKHNLFYTAILAVIISFLSSTMDIALNALRTDILQPNQIGPASSIYIIGYRLGMLIASSGVIYMSVYVSWGILYSAFAVMGLVVAIIIIFLARDFASYEMVKEKIIFKDSNYKIVNLLNKIIKPIGNWRFIVIILTILVLYRIADNFINIMINPFLLHLEFDEYEIATISKTYGVLTAIMGGLYAGHIMQNRNIYRCLFIFGVLHVVAHFLFIMQSLLERNTVFLFTVIGLEGFTGGMTMTAYIALITSLCKGKYSGTQYSFFSSMMGLSRAIFPAISGYIVYHYGWMLFFSFVAISAIPGLVILYLYFKEEIKGTTSSC